MNKTELQIDFHLRGPNIDPGFITRHSGVIPTKTYSAGQLGPKSVPNNLAGWDWRSQEKAEDDEVLWQDLIRTLSPAVETISEAMKKDPDAYVTVHIYGTLTQELISTVEELKRVRYVISDGDDKDPYDEAEQAVIDNLPMLYGDSVGIQMTSEVLAFLAAVNATFESNISIQFRHDKSWMAMQEKFAKERIG